MPLKVHPLIEGRFPPMEGKDFKELRDDIKVKGLLVPIDLYQGMIIDGINRHRAMVELGWADNKICRNARSLDKEIDSGAISLNDFTISKNARRRHLTSEQKQAAIVWQLKTSPEKSDRQIAASVGASPTFVGKVRAEGEATGEVSTVDTRIDAKGVKQPAKKKRKRQTRDEKEQSAKEWAERQFKIDELLAANPDIDAKQLKKLSGAPIGECRSAIEAARHAAEDAKEEAEVKQLAAELHAAGFAQRVLDHFSLLEDALEEVLEAANPATGNDVDPAESAEAMKAAHA